MPARPPHLEAHDDDQPVGRVLTRRQALALFTAPLLLHLAGCSSSEAAGEAPLTGACVARPQLTEGPFFIDADLLRSDIRADAEGVPLALAFTVSQIVEDDCVPLENALVDVWHADANGDYSGLGQQRDQLALRGTQTTDADGRAAFTTIYPGWYRGRAVHIHFKVRSAASAAATYAFTSQLFFDDDLSRRVFQQAPYRTRGPQDVPNDRDGIYRRGGAQMRLAVEEANEGYTGVFDLALVLD